MNLPHVSPLPQALRCAGDPARVSLPAPCPLKALPVVACPAWRCFLVRGWALQRRVPFTVRGPARGAPETVRLKRAGGLP